MRDNRSSILLMHCKFVYSGLWLPFCYVVLTGPYIAGFDMQVVGFVEFVCFSKNCVNPE